MTVKISNASLGSLPEPIKDLLWDDEKGFFENSLRWGGRGLMFVSTPLAIINVAAGALGISLQDIGRTIDAVVTNSPSGNPTQIAEIVFNDLASKFSKKAGAESINLVIQAADPAETKSRVPISFEAEQPNGTKKPVPKTISFEAEQPVAKRKPAPKPVLFPTDSTDTVHNQPSPDNKNSPSPKESNRQLALEQEKMRLRDEADQRKHQRRLQYVDKTFEQQKLLRELDQDAVREANKGKAELAAHHAKVEEAKFSRDRAAMEHQIRTKFEIENKYLRDQKLFDLHRQLILGQITPEQHKVLSAALTNTPISDRDLKQARKSLTRAEREQLQNRLKIQTEEMKHAAKNKELLQRQELKHARLMHGARHGNSGLLSLFSGKVGKAGMIAALAAIIFAGLKVMNSSGETNVPRTRMEIEESPISEADDTIQDAATDTDMHSPSESSSNKNIRNISTHVNSELKDILGD
jgi:hypothetical protein